MAFGIKLKVWGEYACFTRPEMKVERVSYDVMTPSAARGVLEAIYWKPEIEWVIDRIHILKPIRFTNIRRNELGNNKVSAQKIKKAMKEGQEVLRNIIEDDRQQRAATVLKDVAYIIEAHFEVKSGSDEGVKHFEMFKRRATKGQCFNQPYLGCREFTASFEWLDEISEPAIIVSKDLGYMLYDIDFQNNMMPLFFRPEMVNGIIEIKKPEVKQ